MKKFTKVFVIICLLLTLMLSLVACATSGTAGKDEMGRFKLLVPEIELNNDQVVWKEVRYCTKYGVKVDDEDEVVVEGRTFYNVGGVADGSKKSIKVRSIGDGETTVSSDYSNAVEYQAKTQLANPKNLVGTINDDGSFTITWDAVENATKYEISQTTIISTSKKSHSSSKNSITIDKSELIEPDEYTFVVRAKNDDPNYLSSGFSAESVKYLQEKKLDTPAPKFNGTDVSWDTVDNVTNYYIYFKKIDADDPDAYPQLKVSERRSSERAFGKDQVKSAIAEYKKLWEAQKENQGQTFDVAGQYQMAVQAVNTTYSKIYTKSDITVVKKVIEGEENSKDGEEAEDAIFIKPGMVSDIKLVRDESIGDEKIADLLRWTSAEGWKKFKVIYYQNKDKALLNRNVDAKENGEEGASRFDGMTTGEDNLTDVFTGASNRDKAGKVVQISIAICEDFKNGVLEGDEKFWYEENENADKETKRSSYYYVSKELEKFAEEGKQEGFKIQSLADFRYMMENSQENTYYYLTEDINIKASENSVFYGGDRNISFKGIFDGGHHVIANLNLVAMPNANDENISLFNEISKDAIFKNVTFANFKIQGESTTIDRMMLLTNINNGTIEGVNIVGSEFNYSCVEVANSNKLSIAGFAYENNGIIKACGFLRNKINAVGYSVPKEDAKSSRAVETTSRTIDAAGIVVLNNGGQIINSTIDRSNVLINSRQQTVRAAGIAVENRATIILSFSKDSLVRAETIALEGSDVTSLAGGLVALNDSNGEVIESYLIHQGTSSSGKAVEAYTDRVGDSVYTINSVAGGLVGVAKGGKISSCYVTRARIYAKQLAGGLVGSVETNNVTIEQSFVTIVGFVNTKVYAMIANKNDNINITTTNNYCFIQNADWDKDANCDGAIKLNNRSEMTSKEVLDNLGDNFAKYTNNSDNPLLTHMLYSNYNDSDMKVYYVTKDNEKGEFIVEDPIATDIGNMRLQLYPFNNEELGIDFVLPIYRAK